MVNCLSCSLSTWAVVAWEKSPNRMLWNRNGRRHTQIALSHIKHEEIHLKCRVRTARKIHLWSHIFNRRIHIKEQQQHTQISRKLWDGKEHCAAVCVNSAQHRNKTAEKEKKLNKNHKTNAVNLHNKKLLHKAQQSNTQHAIRAPSCTFSHTHIWMYLCVQKQCSIRVTRKLNVHKMNALFIADRWEWARVSKSERCVCVCTINGYICPSSNELVNLRERERESMWALHV